MFIDGWNGWHWAIAGLVLALGVVVAWLSTYRAFEYQRGVVFRFGRYLATRGPGLYFLIPFVDTSRTVDLRVVANEIDDQEMITRDSISLLLSAVVFYRVADPRAATIEVRHYEEAVDQFSLTTLRNIIGACSLDEVLSDREQAAERARAMLDEVTEKWGVEVQRVELKKVELPDSMKRAMAREAEAMREKRARLIKAEAEQDASARLTEAAEMLARSPGAIELRRMQMLAEIGAEHNTTIIVAIPEKLLAATGDAVVGALRTRPA
jgi:regulator of protease activity HflC (stomatin/prohibitin superfamily)